MFSAGEQLSSAQLELQRKNAEIERLKRGLADSQSNHAADRLRLEEEARIADRLKQENNELSREVEVSYRCKSKVNTKLILDSSLSLSATWKQTLG